MASSKSEVSPEEYNVFHSIDRKLYTILVTHLWRDPFESIEIMALWMWLERVGFHNLIPKILCLTHPMINKLAEEAAIGLKCINNPEFQFTADPGEIPLSHCLMNKELTLKFFDDHRENAIEWLPKIIANVCLKTFADIMKIAIKRHADAASSAAVDDAQALSDRHMLIPLTTPSPESIIRGLAQLSLGTINGHIENAQGPATDKAAEEEVVPPDERTMFVTFSKGYPVAEWEVRDFFTHMFGECIESLYMQEVQPTEQALFARVVFYNASVLQMVLNGATKAKFTINGKHVWMRKYVPKPARNSPIPSPTRNLPAATVYESFVLI